MSSRGSSGSRRSSRSKRTPEKTQVNGSEKSTPKRAKRSDSPFGKVSENGSTKSPSINSFDSTVGPASKRTSELSSGNRKSRSITQGILSDPLNLSSPLHYGSTDTQFNASQLSGSNRSHISSYKKRVDIATDSRFVRQINISEAIDGENVPAVGAATSEQSDSSTAPQLVIWGTNVSISNCKGKFKTFLRCPDFDFETLDSDELQPQTQMDLESVPAEKKKPLYLQKLDEIYTLEEPFLNVNCAHVHQFDIELYHQLINYPQEVIPTFDMAANELFFELYPDAQLPHQINVRPFNVIKTSNLRTLNPEEMNQLLTISGMVIRTSNLIPEMREAFFECINCNWNTTVELDRGRIAEPTTCQHCNAAHSLRLIHNRSQFIDKQQIKLQESPENMPAGQTPYTILLMACADLVDAVHPGDRVTVTGIYRATPMRLNPRKQTVKSVYRTHIDVVHYRKIDNKRLHDDAKECNFTASRIDKLKTLSKYDDIYDRLAFALAPSIYEHEDIKKGILLQLFGGTRKEMSLCTNGERTHFRSEINILLCGDPGTSKSQLLQYVYNLVPRGHYTSGKGSSAVGLTAYITKDPDSRQLVLQTGALVLSDGGICCIDEFDKMSDSTRSVLHEVMEQQTMSIAKAGIVCQLNARTSVLAAANPVESQWNKNKTIIENIQLPHTLLSRFDLIFLLLDPQNESYDRRLAKHLVSLYYRSREEEEEEMVDMGLLKDYIAYARSFIHPRLSEAAAQRLIHDYVEMRKAGSGRGQISAYPRQLESLIRLSEAHAKVRLSSVVEIVDVEEARRLHREAIKQSATDPASGKIDISILTTGMSSSFRKKRAEIAEAIKHLLNTMRSEDGSQEHHQFPYQTVFNALKESSSIMVTKEMFDEGLRYLQDERFLVAFGGKYIRLST
ncbi:DNA replication licensing factor mcm4-like protein [Dinothrombium tinctorium]|uniref:DNA replication licensing factor MCM4 n=1 Tax=Dinothrombium tinctorium TaxID=1965070 RepID=A0A3S3RRQ3_9ACAR|nr:DNA replication licensing factor mcm4-like protein [Dinothrombium tinctorium]RWS03748.1 DNA replication licensing factor mcm4-like protein [Dinothrombium tinctorium]RWS04566.1 DNA replication licensing factor mcm4-like protein [Dinothrombium tinctorium]RWS04701.1 DNA replication licensing factor mcm4-like protein [Dinothrombium tinctorium]